MPVCLYAEPLRGLRCRLRCKNLRIRSGAVYVRLVTTTSFSGALYNHIGFEQIVSPQDQTMWHELCDAQQTRTILLLSLSLCLCLSVSLSLCLSVSLSLMSHLSLVSEICLSVCHLSRSLSVSLCLSLSLSVCLSVCLSLTLSSPLPISGASFQLFLGGANFFLIFQCHRTI